MSLQLRLWIAALVIGVLAAAAGAIVHLNPGQGDAEARNRIGGPFTLVNGQGETVTEDSFDGQYRLVYFGYTYCPDVCPTSLLTITRALNSLAETAPQKARAVTPIFITVDPARDTPEIVGDYVSNFHERMVGLTGSPEQIAQAARAYKVRYWKVESEESSSYTMAHTASAFLMGPNGDYLTEFEHDAAPETIAQGLAERVSG